MPEVVCPDSVRRTGRASQGRRRTWWGRPHRGSEGAALFAAPAPADPVPVGQATFPGSNYRCSSGQKTFLKAAWHEAHVYTSSAKALIDNIAAQPTDAARKAAWEQGCTGYGGPGGWKLTESPQRYFGNYSHDRLKRVKAALDIAKARYEGKTMYLLTCSTVCAAKKDDLGTPRGPRPDRDVHRVLEARHRAGQDVRPAAGDLRHHADPRDAASRLRARQRREGRAHRLPRRRRRRPPRQEVLRRGERHVPGAEGARMGGPQTTTATSSSRRSSAGRRTSCSPRARAERGARPQAKKRCRNAAAGSYHGSPWPFSSHPTSRRTWSATRCCAGCRSSSSARTG